jgi:hypothetical protein
MAQDGPASSQDVSKKSTFLTLLWEQLEALCIFDVFVSLTRLGQS